LNNFKKITATRCHSVASHGDFIDVKLGLQNMVILSDQEIRTSGQILVEAYDESIMNFIEARYADQVLLAGFHDAVVDGIEYGYDRIILLTYPRN